MEQPTHPEVRLYYNARGAAVLLGVTERTVRMWIKGKLLPAERDGRQWKIPAEGLSLMPRDRRSLVAQGVRLRSVPESPEVRAWLVACWHQIAEAAFVVHGAQMANGCRCRLCCAMATLAAGYEALPPGASP